MAKDSEERQEDNKANSLDSLPFFCPLDHKSMIEGYQKQHIKATMRVKTRITNGYGESGLEFPGSDSDLTSSLGTELILGAGSAAASTFGKDPSVRVGLASSKGAGRALLILRAGRRALPICWVLEKEKSVFRILDHGLL